MVCLQYGYGYGMPTVHLRYAYSTSTPTGSVGQQLALHSFKKKRYPVAHLQSVLHRSLAVNVLPQHARENACRKKQNKTEKMKRNPTDRHDGPVGK